MRILVLSLIAIIVIISSCKKDEADPKPIEGFFYTGKRDYVSLEPLGSNKTFSLHPMVKQIYTELLKKENQEKFALEFSEKVGVPIWEKSFVFVKNQKNFIAIPICSKNSKQIKGIILGTRSSKNSSGFNSVLIKTNDLFNNKYDDLVLKSYLKLFLILNKSIYGEVNKELVDKYNSVKFNIGIPNVKKNCDFELIQICSDDYSQRTWMGGIENAPPTVDHDRDGVSNDQDQDFSDLLYRLGITPEEFEDRIRDWWDEHYDDIYGDYDDFWEDPTEYIDTDIEWENFWNDYNDGILDHDDDGIRDDIDWDDVIMAWYDDYDDGFKSAPRHKDIRCEWVVVQYCDGQTGFDWTDITMLIDLEVQDPDSDQEQQRAMGIALKNWAISKGWSIVPSSSVPANSIISCRNMEEAKRLLDDLSNQDSHTMSVQSLDNQTTPPSGSVNGDYWIYPTAKFRLDFDYNGDLNNLALNNIQTSYDGVLLGFSYVQSSVSPVSSLTHSTRQFTTKGTQLIGIQVYGAVIGVSKKQLHQCTVHLNTNGNNFGPSPRIWKLEFKRF